MLVEGPGLAGGDVATGEAQQGPGLEQLDERSSARCLDGALHGCVFPVRGESVEGLTMPRWASSPGGASRPEIHRLHSLI